MRDAGKWLKPIALACGTTLGIVPFGILSIPRSTTAELHRFCPSGSCLNDAILVVPFMVVPAGLLFVVVGALLRIRHRWRGAGESVVRFGAALLAIGLIAVLASAALRVPPA